MSANPKQDIGEQLRAFAKQRRDAAGPPFDLHPATRKLLQDEVARTFSARTIARQTTPLSWFAGFWLRMAFAGGGLALLVVAAIFWLPKEYESRLELALKKDTAASAPPATQAREPSLPGSGAIGGGFGGGGVGGLPSPDGVTVNGTVNEPQLAQRFGLAPETTSERTLDLQNQPEEPSRRAESEAAGIRADSTLSLKKNDDFDSNVARVAPSPAVSTPLDSLALQRTAEQVPESVSRLAENRAKLEASPVQSAVTLRDKASREQDAASKRVETLAEGRLSRSEATHFYASVPATNVLYFSQVNTRARYRQNRNSPPVPPVLQSFQVQRSGPNIRVIDADGSVYEGASETPLQAQTGQLGETKNAVATAEANNASGLGRQFFRVSGTNQRLNQLVVFTGELEASTNEAAATLSRGVRAEANSAQAVKLRGRASIGQTVEIPIEATGTAR